MWSWFSRPRHELADSLLPAEALSLARADALPEVKRECPVAERMRL